MDPYQQGRALNVGLGLKLPKIFETEGLLVVVMTRLVGLLPWIGPEGRPAEEP